MKTTALLAPLMRSRSTNLSADGPPHLRVEETELQTPRTQPLKPHLFKWHEYTLGRRDRLTVSSQSAVAIVVQAPLDMAYTKWNQFVEVPHFMKELRETEKLDEARMVWRIEFHGRQVPWEAEIGEIITGRQVSWQNVAGRPCPHSGSIRFEPVSKTTTRLKIDIEFELPGTYGQFTDPLRSVTMLVERSLQRFTKFLQTPKDIQSSGASGRIRILASR